MSAPVRRAWRAAANAVPALETLEKRRWEAQRRRLLEATLDDPVALQRFAAHAPLPDGYGLHFDERLVEIPWVFAQRPTGRVLDAGSALNHDWALRRLVRHASDVHVVTLAPEPDAFTDLGVSYLYADLRDLPLRDASYDTIVSVSTLEHVGMDNAHYGAATPRVTDAAAAACAAVAELRRLLAPGGRLLMTVPFGRAEDHGWLRQFDRAALDELVSAAGAAQSELWVWRSGPRGWQPVEPDDAADAHYGADKAEAVAAVAVTI